MSDITLTLQEYTALVNFARKGAELEGFIRVCETDPTLRPFWEKARAQYGWDPNLPRELEAFLKTVETRSGINRYFLAVRWTEAAAPLPPRTLGAATRFPENWPPQQEDVIELMSRPIARSDVDAVLQAKASRPLDVLVTPDPGKRVGWTMVDDYFR